MPFPGGVSLADEGTAGILEGIGDPVLVFAASGLFDRCNAAATARLPATAVAGASWASFALPGELLATLGHTRRTLHLPTADGASQPFETTVTRLADGRILVHLADRSTEHQRENELKATRLRFETVLDTMREAVLVLDPAGTFVIANKAFCALTGIDRDQIEGRKPVDGWPVIREDGSPYPGDQHPSWVTLTTRKPVRNDVQGVVRPDGSICWLLANTETLVSADGTFEGVLVTLLDITDLKNKQAELERMARTDALTGLANRAAFIEDLGKRLAGRAKDRAMSLLYLDLDSFKAVNDSLGHAVGDVVLHAVGTRVAALLPPGTIFARHGGDEFTAAFDDADGTLARDVADRILSGLVDPIQAGDNTLYVTMSVGIARYPAHGSDGDTLVRHADIAMYRAKCAGRNRRETFDTPMAASVQREFALTTDLRASVRSGDFTVHYQPIVPLTGSGTLTIEALVRWNHPVHGLTPPDDFIGLLEKTGMIAEVGTLVLDKALATVARLRRASHPELRVSVNISSGQLYLPGFFEQIAGALARAGLPGNALELEVSETNIAEDVVAASLVLKKLRRIGVSVAIDDFGTGYSSLQYLRRLPVERLKIDRSFVSAVPHSQDESTITRTIVDLARNLDLDVVAVGVETETQRRFLASLGVRHAQGFLFARPATEEAIADWLAKCPPGG